MSIENLNNDMVTFKKKYPHLADEFEGYHQLCLDEIENGESETNEIQLCYGSINDLIEEDKEFRKNQIP